MWFLILWWLPFVVLVAAYLCSWPRRPSLAQVLCFDGAVVVLLLIRPLLMHFHPEYFAVNEADLLESRQWMSLLIPLDHRLRNSDCRGRWTSTLFCLPCRRRKPSNQSLQLTAGRSDVWHYTMKTPPLQSTLASASGS
jgi:hypothetical protein